MNKFFRRQFWLISAFAKKYYKVTLSSLIISVVVGIIANNYLSNLPKKQQDIRIAIIGQYNSQSLPPLVKNILNSGLTKVGSNQVILPNIAQRWEVGENGKIYNFIFRDGITWSDGTRIKSKDISINIPDVNIEYPSDDQIKFILPQAFSPFPSILTNPITNKEGLTASVYRVQIIQNSNATVSNIKLISDLHTIEIKIYPNPTQAFTSYKLGEVDAIYNYPSTENHDFQSYGFLKEDTNYQQALAIFFNTQEPILKDKAVRQGIAYAIKDKTFGNPRSVGPISLSSWAYNPLVKLYDYDLPKATKLIRSALPENETVLNLELATIPQYLPIAEKIKANLDGGLINLNIKVVTTRPEQYQLYLSSFEIPTDPDQYVFWHSTRTVGNISKISDEKIDKALEDGRRVVDQSNRKQIYFEFQRTFDEEIPALFLYYPKYLNLARNELIFDIINTETNP